MDGNSAIFDAMTLRLRDASLVPDLPIAWPNVHLAESEMMDGMGNAKAHLRVFFLPAATERVTLGANGVDRHRGLLQISVFWPEGQGHIPASQFAGQIVELFKLGTEITHEGWLVRVSAPPFLNPAVSEAGWYSLPVRIPYFADPV